MIMKLRFSTNRFMNNHRAALMRYGIIGGVIVLALGLGMMLGREMIDPALLLAAVVAPLAGLILLRLGRFEYGLLAITLTAGMFNFFALSTGSESRIVISLMVTMLMIGVWLLQFLLVEKRFYLKSSAVNKPILLFMLVNVISYVWSGMFRDELMWVWSSFPIVQIAALVVNMVLPGLVLLFSNKIQEVKWLKWLTWLMVGMGAYVVISLRVGLPTQMFDNGSSGLFATWVSVLALSLVLFVDDLDKRIKVILLGILGLWLYRNFVEGLIWLAGWMPIIIACVTLIFLRSKKMFAVIAVIGLIFLMVNFEWFYEKIYVANAEEGGLQRLDLWAINLGHVANHPLFGMGPAGYAIYNMTYNPEDARSTHNNYFDVLAQVGIVGSLVFIWMWVAFFRVGFKTRRMLNKQRNFEEAFVNAVLAGSVAAVVAMMLGDWVLPFAYNSTIEGFDHSSYTWMLIGGMISLYHIARRQTYAANEPELSIERYADI